MSSASILPISDPIGASVPPPSASRSTLHRMLSQLLIGVLIPVAYNLLSDKLDLPPSNSLHLYEFYEALVISLLSTAILLCGILSSGEIFPDWLVHWVHASACCSLFVAFILRFSFQVPKDYFVRSCLIFAGILLVQVLPPLLLWTFPDFFKLRFHRIRARLNL